MFEAERAHILMPSLFYWTVYGGLYSCRSTPAYSFRLRNCEKENVRGRRKSYSLCQ